MLKKTFLCFFLLVFTCNLCLAAKVDDDFTNLKTSFEELSKDNKKKLYRHNWIDLADKFWQLYDNNKNWNNRVSALYKSAQCLEQMATYSFVSRDAFESSARFELLAKNHPNSSLADDALFSAANLRYNRLKDNEYAIKLLDMLNKNYQHGDMLSQANELKKTIQAKTSSEENSKKEEVNKKEDTTKKESPKQESPKEASSKTAPKAETKTDKAKSETPKTDEKKVDEKKAETKQASSSSTPTLNKISWDLNKAISKVDLHLDQVANWDIIYYPARNSTPDRLVIELLDVQAAKKPAGGYVAKGKYALAQAVTRVAVDYGTRGKTRIIIDCPGIKKYDINLTGLPYKLTIEVSKNAKDLADGYTPTQKPKADISKLDGLKKVPIEQLAKQLNLQIQTVVIDAGHGGKDPGSDHNDILEKTYVLDLALQIGKILEKNKIAVKYTRSDDSFLSLSERVKLANDYKADLFISIHVNANKTDSVQGFETYYLDVANSTHSAQVALKENNNERSLGEMNEVLADLMLSFRTYESKKLAEYIHTSTVSKIKPLKGQDGKLKGAPFYVLMGITMPGALVEVGYNSNNAESALLKNSKYQDAIANGIANGIIQYKSQL